ncbi:MULTISPECIES: type II secretion system minor pseudopilin GspK [unclassified Moraxella]|uniref:type II secretion system minor pseudopilin GspK n=1 Tax=unclassified Moraxella TaxID=2685852 RepID=UPI003AF5E455
MKEFDKKVSMPTQQGMALLTILLLVVAITIIAGSMLASQKVMLRQYELTKNQGQMYEYALAGEAIAIELIDKDSQINQTDSVQDAWAKPIPSHPVTGGAVQVQIRDQASLFNINNLYHDGKVDKQALAFFQALLQSHDIEPNVAFAVLDWQDPDSDPTPEGGAEADYYQSTGKPMPIAIANQPFLAVDELVYVRGMDKQKLAKIKPLLTALPFFVPMNVNTVQPSLLSILPMVSPAKENANNSNNAHTDNNGNSQNGSNANPNGTPNANNAQNNNSNNNSNNHAPNSMLDMSQLASWASKRSTAMPVQSLDEFWQQPVFASISGQQQAVNGLLAVDSRVFESVVAVKVDDKSRYLVSQIAKIPASNANNGLNNPTNSVTHNGQVQAFNRRFLAVRPE